MQEKEYLQNYLPFTSCKDGWPRCQLHAMQAAFCAEGILQQSGNIYTD